MAGLSSLGGPRSEVVRQVGSGRSGMPRSVTDGFGRCDASIWAGVSRGPRGMAGMSGSGGVRCLVLGYGRAGLFRTGRLGSVEARLTLAGVAWFDVVRQVRLAVVRWCEVRPGRSG